MNLLFWGLTIGTLGKVILGVAVIRVHLHILHEHKIDSVVLASIKRERYVTTLGVFLIILGYALELMFYGYTPLLTCTLGECSAALSAAFEAIR